MAPRMLIATAAAVALAVAPTFAGATTTPLLAPVAAHQQDEATGNPAHQRVRVWSYAGPRADVAGGRVVLRDARGRIIGAKKTTQYGAAVFHFPGRRHLNLPLTVTVSGGTAAGKAFRGHLKARVFGAATRDPIVQTSLVSTAASKMASTRSGYAKATNRVRRTLGLQGHLDYVLKLRNSAVGYSELMRVSGRAGGFDAFAALVAKRARAGKRITGLKPKSANASGAPGWRSRFVQRPTRKPALSRKASNQATTLAPDTSVCSVGVPDSGSTFSNEAISDVGVLGVGSLMQVAGLPETTATESITGMLLAPIGLDSSATVQQSAYQAVAADLYCLSEQTDYISKQLSILTFDVDVDTASTCAADINGNTGYSTYLDLVTQADTSPINAQNVSLQDDVSDWNTVANACGGIINQMLFGNTGLDLASTWAQLNANTSAGLEWYDGATVQYLQTFLDNWGTLIYEQFILENEYYNYKGDWTNAQGAAGVTTNSAGQPVCGTPATSTAPALGSPYTAGTYCVAQSNIAAAWPGDLYSDEIGVLSSGESINAYPGGLIAPTPVTSSAPGWGLEDKNTAANQTATPTAMNLAWWWNYYLNFTSYNSNKGGSNAYKFYATGGQPTCVTSVVGNCPPSTPVPPNWAQTAVDTFNAQTVNPKGLGSAVETYVNPQNTGRTPALSTDISALKSNGPGNATSLTFLYNAINQVSYNGSPAWSPISSSQVSYWTADTSSAIQVQAQVAVYFEMPIEVSAPLGSTSGYASSTKNNENQANLPTTPVFAFLSKRTWWPGAANASSFVPPAPAGP